MYYGLYLQDKIGIMLGMPRDIYVTSYSNPLSRMVRFCDYWDYTTLELWRGGIDSRSTERPANGSFQDIKAMELFFNESDLKTLPRRLTLDEVLSDQAKPKFDRMKAVPGPSFWLKLAEQEKGEKWVAKPIQAASMVINDLIDRFRNMSDQSSVFHNLAEIEYYIFKPLVDLTKALFNGMTRWQNSNFASKDVMDGLFDFVNELARIAQVKKGELQDVFSPLFQNVMDRIIVQRDSLVLSLQAWQARLPNASPKP